MTENKSPEFKDEFTQRISAEITVFVLTLQKVGPLKIASSWLIHLKLSPLKLVHSNLFPFYPIGLDDATLVMMRY